ncbi:hypothetical protein BDZ45DRAFT_808795 [Acephala macrosclerotiorum]|nr:hypothetical protein BDZ45DRAFT_808795 [Acephala macrosclerotiorum]
MFFGSSLHLPGEQRDQLSRGGGAGLFEASTNQAACPDGGLFGNWPSSNPPFSAQPGSSVSDNPRQRPSTNSSGGLFGNPSSATTGPNPFGAWNCLPPSKKASGGGHSTSSQNIGGGLFNSASGIYCMSGLQNQSNSAFNEPQSAQNTATNSEPPLLDKEHEIRLNHEAEYWVLKPNS